MCEIGLKTRKSDLLRNLYDYGINAIAIMSDDKNIHTGISLIKLYFNRKVDGSNSSVVETNLKYQIFTIVRYKTV